MRRPRLPHVPSAQAYGGQGPLTLYAVANDIEGSRTLLGRSSNPASTEYATPTLITMANDSIAKPFGAIDTPGQGETISGIFNNFGWAITPDMNAIVDGTDIRIPANGSTMTVFIDGLPVSLVAYNQCRGTVGNPVPTGVYCNDDVSNIFGNPSPQPPTTTRTSNPTLFRNLDSASAPIGAYTFDTSTLTDGLHTIAWSVSDSAGRNEGIGSRFFNVLNAVPDAARDAALRAAPARVVGPTAMLGRHRVGTGGVWGRTGFDMETAWIAMRANATRTYTVRLPELGRLELWLGAPVDAGYLVAGGTLQPLDEWGNPLPVKDEGYYDVAFPIQRGGTAWGTNRESRAMMTVAEAQRFTLGALRRDADWMRRHFLAALFDNTTWTFQDDFKGAFTVQPLANGDAGVSCNHLQAPTGRRGEKWAVAGP